MSNYMKGYSNRTRRRRASYKKTNSLYENSYYNSRSRWMGKDTGTGRKKWIYFLVFLGIAAVAVGITAFVLKGFGRKGDRTPENNIVSGSASSSAATPAGTPETTAGTVTRAVIAAGELNEDAISKPAPKQRSKAIALTFDDGPSTTNTPKVLSLLEKYNAHATFFVVGNRVAPGAALLKKEVALGCEIGNHSWNHANLSKMKIKQVNKNLNKTKRLVKKLTGYEISLTRPPFGAISKVMRKKLDQPMILWSVDTLDWKSRNAKAVLKQVKKQVRDGAVILVHDIHESTAEAMKTVLPWLLKNDYDILTVSELMERKGVKMKAGKAYCNVD